jgi:hypothetical protein
MNAKGNQQPRGNKKKNRNNNCKGGNNNNNNKSKDENINDKSNNNVGERKKSKIKVKFPFKICKDDYLTHLCPKMEEASRLIAQHPVVLDNLFPHNKNMTLGVSNTINTSSGGQNPLVHDGGHQCVNMVRSEISVANRTRYYGSSQLVLGTEPPLLETHL